MKLSSWREVLSLLSCSCEPSGSGSHRDADALQALFARPSPVFAGIIDGLNVSLGYQLVTTSYRGGIVRPLPVLSQNKRNVYTAIT